MTTFSILNEDQLQTTTT